MKNCKGYFAIRVAMVLLFCCSLTLLDAQPKGRSGARIQKTNWSNSMGCTAADDICVALLPDDILIFKLIAQFADPHVEDYPTMHFNYFFPDYNPLYPLFGYTDAITPDMVEPTLLETGDSAWKASFYFEINLAEHCTAEDNFFFKVEYQLVTQVPSGTGYMPYPVVAYPRLFPPDTFSINSTTGFADYVRTDKEMCCNNEVYSCTEDATASGGASSRSFESGKYPSGKLQILENIHVFPNPISAYINIYFDEQPISNELILEVFDANGRVIFQKTYFKDRGQSIVIPTEDWFPGMYFIKFSSENQTVVKKVVK